MSAAVLDRIGSALLFGGAVVVVLLLTGYTYAHDTLALRTLPWGQQAACPTRLISDDPGSPQTLVLGTSRAMQGIAADELAAAMGQPAGSIINLASNGRATDLQYLIAEELAHRGRLHRVIVELSVGSPAADGLLAQSREAGAEMGSGASFLQSEAATVFASRRQITLATADLPLLARWQDRLQKTLNRLSTTARSGMRIVARRLNLVATPDIAVSEDLYGCRQPMLRRARLVAPPAEQLDSSGDYFTRPATRADRANYRRIAQLGQRHGIDVLFVRMPDRFSPLDAADLAQHSRRARR
jgi:hypothetical protein